MTTNPTNTHQTRFVPVLRTIPGHTLEYKSWKIKDTEADPHDPQPYAQDNDFDGTATIVIYNLKRAQAYADRLYELSIYEEFA
jgi:hypothetical protein